jgi:two-component system chemotaxis response regulator CheB
VATVTTAANCTIGLAKIPQANPDVVVVDLDLPERDPLDTVRRIRAAYPGLPVVVDSSHTEPDGVLAVRALEAGATRCLTRPDGLSGDALVDRTRGALVPVLLEVCNQVAEESAPTRYADDRVRRRVAVVPQVPEVLAVAASTGGPDALETLLTGLPGDLPVPVVVVQHMPAGFTAQLARRLTSRCGLPVAEAEHMDVLRPGRVLVAPGGVHMRVRRQGSGAVVHLDKGIPENFCRPSVDVLFRSVAAAYGPAALAVVLTGMGADGTRGAADLVAGGSEVIVQDEPSSTVWGMPGSVSNAGLAAEVLPLHELAAAILRRIALTPESLA